MEYDPRAEFDKSVQKAGSLNKLAKEWHITASYLSMISRGGKPFSDRVLEKMGLQRVVTYRRIKPS